MRPLLGEAAARTPASLPSLGEPDSPVAAASPTEQWRPCPGLEGILWVSDLGRVKDADGAIKTYGLQGWGYYLIQSRNAQGRKVRLYVHRAVLLAFVGPDPARPFACHINDIGTDNRLVNLRWGTPAENMRDRDRNGAGPTGARNGRAKLTAEDIHAIRRRKRAGETSTRIARDYPVSEAQIRHICRGFSWGHLETA